MKKILLTAAAVAVLTASPVYAEEGDFFLKANVGGVKLNKMNSFKSDNNMYFGVGAGYNLMDNARVDLAYDHFFEPTFKRSGDGISSKTKLNIDTILLNGFVDVVDLSVAKIFTGAGVGVARIGGKQTDTDAAGVSESIKYKAENKFGYALYLGSSTEFAPGVNAELTYSWRGYSKLKDADKNLQGHHISAGVRFDI